MWRSFLDSGFLTRRLNRELLTLLCFSLLLSTLLRNALLPQLDATKQLRDFSFQDLCEALTIADAGCWPKEPFGRLVAHHGIKETQCQDVLYLVQLEALLYLIIQLLRESLYKRFETCPFKAKIIRCLFEQAYNLCGVIHPLTWLYGESFQGTKDFGQDPMMGRNNSYHNHAGDTKLQRICCGFNSYGFTYKLPTIIIDGYADLLHTINIEPNLQSCPIVAKSILLTRTCST